MNKKNLLLIVILVALPIAYYFLSKNIESNTEISKDHFAIKDLEQIDKIFISENKGKNYALLTKDENNIWRVNNNWVINESRLKILFETFRDIEVKYEVDEKAAKPILAQIAATGVKTIIYSGDKVLKSYFVGTPTNDMMGTFMVESGSKKPVVVHIPGMNGFVSSRYFTDSIEWRNKNIFNIPKNEIKEIKVTWANSPRDNFTITQTGDNIVFVPNNAVELNKFNELKVKAFLNLFMVYENNNLACEGFHKEFSKEKSDSIASNNWFFKIDVLRTNGQTKILKLFHKPIQVNTYDAYDDAGQPLQFEIDKYYGVQNDEKLIMEIQDLVFSKIMKKPSDFK